ncbi:uncharacterized protein LOC110738601 [Chenopodium quinoa]|uniref:uncharacterized protein LOC110738601 n=1 Tax=Chenopodium quinoa TaxID=63459 RepID=UPI000B786023|nr:uncharacterized protein LOC110738601 [Chenopodium quinoa]
MLCPGFVNVNHEFPVDVVLEPMSKRGGVIRTRYFSVFKDPKDGNWWLITGYMKTVQGFWPRKIFNGLANSATFGGEAFGPVDQPLPPMGNGYRGIAELLYAALIHEITVLDENFKEDYDPKETETYSDDPQYRIIDYGWTYKYGRLIFYGGTTPQI